MEVEGPFYIPKLYDGRNRTFFMYNWEDIRDSVPFAQTYTVATPAERNGDFSGLLNSTGQRVTIYDPLTTVASTVNGVTTYSRTAFPGNIIPQNRMSRVARNMLAYLPLPNVPGNGFGQNNFSVPSNTRSDKYDIHSFRFDHAFNEQNKFFADVLRSNRHEVNDTAGFVGPASPLYLHWRTTPASSLILPRSSRRQPFWTREYPLIATSLRSHDMRSASIPPSSDFLPRSPANWQLRRFLT